MGKALIIGTKAKWVIMDDIPDNEIPVLCLTPEEEHNLWHGTKPRREFQGLHTMTNQMTSDQIAERDRNQPAKPTRQQRRNAERMKRKGRK